MMWVAVWASEGLALAWGRSGGDMKRRGICDGHWEGRPRAWMSG